MLIFSLDIFISFCEYVYIVSELQNIILYSHKEQYLNYTYKKEYQALIRVYSKKIAIQTQIIIFVIKLNCFIFSQKNVFIKYIFSINSRIRFFHNLSISGFLYLFFFYSFHKLYVGDANGNLHPFLNYISCRGTMKEFIRTQMHNFQHYIIWWDVRRCVLSTDKMLALT